MNLCFGRLKKMGFADKQIARAQDKTPDEIRDLRKKFRYNSLC